MDYPTGLDDHRGSNQPVGMVGIGIRCSGERVYVLECGEAMNIERFIRAVHAAETLVNDSQDDQWQLPPNPTQQVGGRSNKVSDPTFNITSDERRMRLRAQVEETERLLALASIALERQAKNLEEAIDAWQGNLPEKS